MLNKILEKINETRPQEQKFGATFGFYQLFWIFFIGCFLGVIIEILFCLVKNGYYESRVGLVYGPFNLVYGFGALALTLGLHWCMEKSIFIIFIGGAIIGSIVEYVCSWVQQQIVGTISWDYSQLPFNLNGRINLLYSAFWGILAILWVKFVYPLMLRWIEKIPKKYGYILTWCLLLFLAFDTAVSGYAVYRWTERQENIPASSVVEHFFDERFSNERMQKIYPNMKRIS